MSAAPEVVTVACACKAVVTKDWEQRTDLVMLVAQVAEMAPEETGREAVGS